MKKVISPGFLKFLIVIIAFQDVAAGVAGSIMADIIEAYPNYNPTIVMLVATFPGFIQIIPALLYGKIAGRFKKRTLLFSGLIFFMIGGVGPFFVDSLPLIIAFRGLLGLGVGITMPLSVDIITSFFEGRERDFLIGFGTSTVACIGAIFFQLVGGILADAYGWQYGFLTYLFPIWILALTFLYLPEPEASERTSPTLRETFFSAPKTVYGFSIGQIIFSAVTYGYVTNISVVIQAEQLGNATEAGMAISIYTFGTLLTGFIFGRLRSFMPISIVPVSIIFSSIGMFICYMATSYTGIIIGSLIGGAAMGIVLPGVFARVSEVTPRNSNVSFVGFVVAAQGIGGIIAPFVYQVVLDMFSLEIGRSTLLIATIGYFALAIIWWLLVKLPQKAPIQNTELNS